MTTTPRLQSTGGGASGHTSSTRHGAWSTTKRAAGPRLRGPSREWSPSRASTSRSVPSAAADDLALDAPAARLERGVAPEALARVGEQRLRGLVGDARAAARRRRAAAGRRPSSPRRAPPATRLDVAGRDVQQRDLGVGGQQRGGLGDRGLPRVLDDPDQRAHQVSTCAPNHRSDGRRDERPPAR